MESDDNGAISDQERQEAAERSRDRAQRAYDFLRREVNENQALGYFNCKNGNELEGVCSACRETQPWAEPWKLRKRWLEAIICLSFALLALALVAAFVSLSIIYNTSVLMWFVTVLASVAVLGLTILAMDHVVQKLFYDPQYAARSKSICEAMENSRYYEQSYPYIACESDILIDLKDQRAQLMVAELWPDKLRKY